MSNPDSLASLPCNLCGGQDVTVASRRSRSGSPLRSVACTGCGLVWSDPRPHEARQFYTEDYRLAYKQTFEPRPRHVLRAGQVALSRLQKIRGLLRPRMKILDVGSGGGEFAYLLKSLGHDVLGAEPNRGYASYSEQQYGLAIRRGFIGDIALPDAAFDLITIWHVLEHTEDPGAVLRQLRRALRPGGKLVVEVPNVGATCQSPRSSFHEAHLYTFGVPTLHKLARKSGLDPLAAVLSADGGNLTATYAADPELQAAQAEGWRLPGNHQQVAAVIAAHTPLSHALSMHPWRRAAGRLGRALAERRALRSAGTGKVLLDALYAREVQPRPAAATRRPSWAWLAGAYAFALLMEELLLDRVLPLDRFSDSQTLGIYVALQCVVVGGLLSTFKQRPGSVRELARVGGWAAPLFAIPAFC